MPFMLGKICHCLFGRHRRCQRLTSAMAMSYKALCAIFFLTLACEWHILINTLQQPLQEEPFMNNSREQPSKQEILRRHCCLNPHPDTVRDELFVSDDFFDPRDLPQVKYEMLRRVVHDKKPVSQSASDFGFSRVSFYQARDAFQSEGLSGLLPRKRGPKNRHKLTGEIMNFVNKVREREETISPVSLAQQIQERFGIHVHPRSVQRAVAAQKKNSPAVPGKPGDPAAEMTERYEHMRAMRRIHQQRTQEMELMISSGMVAWIGAWADYGSPIPQINQRGTRCDTDKPPTMTPISCAAHGEAVGILSAMVWDIVKEDVHGYSR